MLEIWNIQMSSPALVDVSHAFSFENTFDSIYTNLDQGGSTNKVCCHLQDPNVCFIFSFRSYLLQRISCSSAMGRIGIPLLLIKVIGFSCWMYSFVFISFQRTIERSGLPNAFEKCDPFSKRKYQFHVAKLIYAKSQLENPYKNWKIQRIAKLIQLYYCQLQ